MKHFVDLQSKTNLFIRGAYERLVMQTLWDTHPTSFYHSASQELLSIIRYFLRKHPLINYLIKCDCQKEYLLSEIEDSSCTCGKLTKAFDKVNLTWENKGNKISIKEFSETSTHFLPIDVSFKDWTITIKLNYFEYNNNPNHNPNNNK